MDYPVEFTAVTADSFVESKYFDKIYDAIVGKPKQRSATISDTQRPQGDRQKPASAVSRARSQRQVKSEYDLDDESLESERVLREYEAERDDPKRKITPSLVAKSVSQQKDPRRDSGKMSHANGGYGRSERPGSQRGGTKYDDYYDDEYESDYDDRTGRRARTTGRGYDTERDRSFDREIIETERYRGVSHTVVQLPIRRTLANQSCFCSPPVSKILAVSTIPTNLNLTFHQAKTTKCNPTAAHKATS